MKLKLTMWMIIPAILIFLITKYITSSEANEVEPQNNLPKLSDATIHKDEIAKVKLDLIDSFEWEKRGVVTFWFDDAWMSQYTNGFPILEKHGFKGALAVPTELIKYEGYIKWWQIKKLQFNGWEINSHSVSHECDQEIMTYEKLEFELRYSKIEIMSQGLLADNYVVPCGVVDDKLNEIAKTYYKSMRTSEPGLNDIPLEDPYFIKADTIINTTKIEDIKVLLNDAKVNRKWIVLMFHQIDYSNDIYAITPEFLGEIAKLVEGSKLQVALPEQILSIK